MYPDYFVLQYYIDESYAGCAELFVYARKEDATPIIKPRNILPQRRYKEIIIFVQWDMDLIDASADE